MTININEIVTKEMINNLNIGDTVPNCFGKMEPITKITGKGVSLTSGKAYACFYQTFGNGAEISNDIAEGNKFYTLKLPG